VLKYGEQTHSKEAGAFYDFLFSSPAREIFKKYGYKLP
jgi:ABC-type molybdate transport system substrate-binding protein